MDDQRKDQPDPKAKTPAKEKPKGIAPNNYIPITFLPIVW